MRPFHPSVHAVVSAVVFSAAVVVSVVVHLDHPLARSFVGASVNRILSSALVGHVVVDRVQGLSLTYIRGIDAHADAPDGAPVLRVEGVDAHVSIWTLVRSLVGGKNVVVDVPDLSIARAELDLETSRSGRLRIAGAFTPRAPSSDERSGRSLHLRLTDVALSHGTIHVPGPLADVSIQGVTAGVRVEEGTVAIDVDRSHLATALSGGLPASADVTGHMTSPGLHANAVAAIVIGGVAGRAEASYDEGRISAVVDVPFTDADALRSLWPASPVDAPVVLHVEAQGGLPRLDTVARLQIGAGTIDLHGPIDVGSKVHIAAHLDASAFDVRTVAPSLPPSNLASSADVSFTAAAEGIAASASIDFEGGVWGAFRVPAATIRGDVALPSGGLPTANGVIETREQGALVNATVRLAPKGRSVSLIGNADVTVPRLETVERLRGFLHGSARATVSGSIDFASGTVTSRASIAGSDLRAGPATLSSLTARLGVEGKLSSPSIDAELTGSGLDAWPLSLSTFHAKSGAAIEGEGVTLRDLDVEAAGQGAPAHVHASVVRLAPDRASVADALVEGLGAPLSATADISPSSVIVRAKTAGLLLERIRDFAAIPVRNGTVSLDADATIAAGAADGRLALRVEHASLFGVRDANVDVQASVRGREAVGRADVGIEDIGSISVRSSSVDIGPGSLVTAAPWRKTWGALAFKAHADLGKVTARLPPGLLPIDRLTGSVDVQGSVDRDSIDDATPSVDVRVRTTGLSIAGRRSGVLWHIEGIDPSVRLTVDGNTGMTHLESDVGDAAGPLVRMTAASSAVPYAVFFSDEQPIDALRATPFDANVDILSRRLEAWPQVLGVGKIGGLLEGRLAWHGSVTSPTVDLTATLSDTRLAPGVTTQPLDLAVDGKYDGSLARVNLRGLVRGTEVARATGTLDVRASDMAEASRDAPIPWSGSMHASLDKMPLRLFSSLYDRQVHGTATGEVVVDGLHRDARASAALTFDGLQVGDVTCRSATVNAGVDGRAFDLRARVEHGDGFAEARAHVGARWGAELAPQIDSASEASVSFSANRFRAAMLLPFVAGAVTELDGRIDAAVRADFGAGTPFRPKGTIDFRNGTFELASFGSEFRDASAKIALTPDGVVRVENVVARGLSGTVRAAATARFDAKGLAAARASFRMPAKDPLPLVFDGMQMGQLDGAFDVSVDRASSGTDIAVDVPVAHVQLPTGSSSLDVQSLGDVDGVEIGMRDGADGFTPVSLDAARDPVSDPAVAWKSETKVTVRLGHDVHVSRGSTLDVRLEGQPVVAMGQGTRVSGQIRMPSGSIDVQGKAFEIEKGTVTFVGKDPSNPQVVLTAGWTAPDGTRIYADYVGPLKTAQVRLRSSPSRSQNEILALILYGSADDATTSAATTTSQSSPLGALAGSVSPFAAVAGGAATQPLNQALRRMEDSIGLTGGGISTKIDTTQAMPRPEVEIEIARNISLQVALVLGEPPPGTNPDTTLVTLDWRFLRRWSLETTVGDAGTSILNVVWQQRY